MESILIIVFIISILSFSLQLQLQRKSLISFMWLAIIGVFTYTMHHYAIEQSYSTIKETLGNTSVIMDFVVLLIIEALGGIFMNLYLVRSNYNEPSKKVFKYFKYLPGIILFPAIFYFETIVFLQMPGYNFTAVGIGVSIAFVLIVWLLCQAFKLGMPELELKFEVKFILHLLQLGLGIFLSIIISRLPVNHLQFPEHGVSALALLISLLIVGSGIGVMLYNIKMKRVSKTIK